MKLDTWFEKEIKDFHTARSELPKGLHVVGTCGGDGGKRCKYFNLEGACINETSLELDSFKGPAETCIHWVGMI